MLPTAGGSPHHSACEGTLPRTAPWALEGPGRDRSKSVRPFAEPRLHCLPSMAATRPIPICRERVVSIQHQEDPAGFVLANQSKILLRPFLAGYIGVGHRHDFPALRGPARVLLSPAADGRQRQSSRSVRGIANPGPRFALRASRGFQAP